MAALWVEPALSNFCGTRVNRCHYNIKNSKSSAIEVTDEAVLVRQEEAELNLLAGCRRTCISCLSRPRGRIVALLRNS